MSTSPSVRAASCSQEGQSMDLALSLAANSSVVSAILHDSIQRAATGTKKKKKVVFQIQT